MTGKYSQGLRRVRILTALKIACALDIKCSVNKDADPKIFTIFKHQSVLPKCGHNNRDWLCHFDPVPSGLCRSIKYKDLDTK